MIKAISVTLDPATKTAEVFLNSDTREEVTTDPKDAIGMPDGYTYAPFSKCMTKKKELAILGSDGEWDWGD